MFIFSLNFETGTSAEAVETTLFVLMFRSVGKFIFQNYRPIGLWPILSKIIEPSIIKS